MSKNDEARQIVFTTFQPRRGAISFDRNAAEEARAEAFKDAAVLARTMAAGETYETGRQKALNIAIAIEQAAASVLQSIHAAQGMQSMRPETPDLSIRPK